MSPLGFLRFPTRFCPSLMVPEFVSKERYWPRWLGHGSRWLWRWWHPGHLGRRHGCQSQDVQDVQGKSMKEHERNHRNPLKFIETIPYIPSPDYFIPLHSICFISFSSWMMAAKHFIAPLCHDELGWMTFFFRLGWSHESALYFLGHPALWPNIYPVPWSIAIHDGHVGCRIFFFCQDLIRFV